VLAALAVLVLAHAPVPAQAQDQNGHDSHGAVPASQAATASQAAPAQPVMPAMPAAPGAPAPPDKVGVVERLGEHIPEGIVMRDEAGRPVEVRDLLKVPTILVPVYYTCPTACSLLMGWMAQVLPQVGLKPGRDYQVVCVSFDENDTPELAARKRHEFTVATKGGFPPEHWRFLTGDLPSINALMAAIGFGFKREGKMFQHPVVTVAVSPKGKITRYLYGSTPLAFDIAMAATEAAGDTTGVSITRALAFCYSYDPQGQRYVFNLMRVAGISVLFALALFGVFLYAAGRKRARRQREGKP
jgi:protein SCO1/2